MASKPFYVFPSIINELGTRVYSPAPSSNTVPGLVSNDWAELFKKSGARYVVLTTKHHDGFCLWPTKHPNPKKKSYFSKRHLVGKLAKAVRARGIRMELYHSHGLDWTFNDTPIQRSSGPLHHYSTRPRIREVGQQSLA